ncbi:hypothetical protein B0H63DRAFT_161965 [Podospora didyma]|uniref:Uncharacterized protein n=1 Tax=Podospora didyma TaxID=330526 RepID=A0AAE0NTU8_9PEZI|nr:hypothetical protein B0H63DRAFT_161965 [Podospora didyma]
MLASNGSFPIIITWCVSSSSFCFFLIFSSFDPRYYAVGILYYDTSSFLVCCLGLAPSFPDLTRKTMPRHDLCYRTSSTHDTWMTRGKGVRQHLYHHALPSDPGQQAHSRKV